MTTKARHSTLTKMGPVTAEEIAAVLDEQGACADEGICVTRAAAVIAALVAERWETLLRRNWCDEHRHLATLDQPMLECGPCEWAKREAAVQALIEAAEAVLLDVCYSVESTHRDGDERSCAGHRPCDTPKHGALRATLDAVKETSCAG